MPVMNSKGDLFDERRKDAKKKSNKEVSTERRSTERRKKNINSSVRGK